MGNGHVMSQDLTDLRREWETIASSHSFLDFVTQNHILAKKCVDEYLAAIIQYCETGRYHNTPKSERIRMIEELSRLNWTEVFANFETQTPQHVMTEFHRIATFNGLFRGVLKLIFVHYELLWDDATMTVQLNDTEGTGQHTKIVILPPLKVDGVLVAKGCSFALEDSNSLISIPVQTPAPDVRTEVTTKENKRENAKESDQKPVSQVQASENGIFITKYLLGKSSSNSNCCIVIAKAELDKKDAVVALVWKLRVSALQVINLVRLFV
eukprot:c2571_g1_i2.p1 GENE.c2571_g1_i2~~c2571_g1_i2.p1  ORF type:complete len:268 (-),score=59.54 c2571_g1_i2:369-1172(-)